MKKFDMKKLDFNIKPSASNFNVRFRCLYRNIILWNTFIADKQTVITKQKKKTPPSWKSTDKSFSFLIPLKRNIVLLIFYIFPFGFKQNERQFCRSEGTQTLQYTLVNILSNPPSLTYPYYLSSHMLLRNMGKKHCPRNMVVKFCLLKWENEVLSIQWRT